MGSVKPAPLATNISASLLGGSTNLSGANIVDAVDVEDEASAANVGRTMLTRTLALTLALTLTLTLTLTRTRTLTR